MCDMGEPGQLQGKKLEDRRVNRDATPMTGKNDDASAEKK
jgi:hypothetical protein